MILAGAQTGQTTGFKVAHRVVTEAEDVASHTAQEPHARGDFAQGAFGDPGADAGMVGGAGDARRKDQEFGAELLGLKRGQLASGRAAGQFVAHTPQGSGARVRVAGMEVDPDLRQLQPRPPGGDLIRQAAQPVADLRDVAVADQRHAAGLDQTGGHVTVARRQGVLHGVRSQTGAGQPLRGAQMQARQPDGIFALKDAAQQVGEEGMVAEPCPVGIKRDKEQVGRFDLPDAVGCVARARDGVGEGGRKTLQNGGAEEEIQHLGRLAAQHFLDEEIRDVACGTGEAVEKA